MEKNILLPEEINALLCREEPGLKKEEGAKKQEELTMTLQSLAIPLSMTDFLHLNHGSQVDLSNVLEHSIELHMNGQLVGRGKLDGMVLHVTEFINEKERLDVLD